MSIHLNDTLSNLSSSSTLIIPTNFNSNTISSIDLLSNVGSSDTINISIQQQLLLSGSASTTGSVAGQATSALKIAGSDVENATLVRIIDAELFGAENKRGGAAETFVKYDENGSVYVNELLIGGTSSTEILTDVKVKLLTDTLNGNFPQIDRYVSAAARDSAPIMIEDNTNISGTLFISTLNVNSAFKVGKQPNIVTPSAPYGSTGDLIITDDNLVNVYSISANEGTVSLSGHILPMYDKISNLGSNTKRFKNLYVDDITGISGLTLSGHILSTISGTFDLGSSAAPFRNLYVGDVYSSSSSLNVGDGWVISTLGSTLRMIKVKDKNRLPPLITNFRDALFEYGILFLQKFKKTTTVNGSSSKSKSKVFNYLKLLLSPTDYLEQIQGIDKNVLLTILNTVIKKNQNKYVIIVDGVEQTLATYQEVYQEHLDNGNDRWKYKPSGTQELTIKGKKYKFTHNLDEIEFGDLTLELIRLFMEHDVKNAINVKRSSGGDFVEEFTLENGAFNSGLKFNTEGKIIGTFNEERGEYETGQAKDFYEITYDGAHEDFGFDSYNDNVVTSDSLTGNILNIKKKKITIPNNASIDTSLDYKNNLYIFEIILLDDDDNEIYWEGNEIASMSINESNNIEVKVRETFYLEGLNKSEIITNISQNKITYGIFQETYMEQGFFGDSDMMHGYVADEIDDNFTTNIKRMIYEDNPDFDDCLPSNWTKQKTILLPFELGTQFDGYFTGYYIQFFDINGNSITQLSDASVTHHEIEDHMMVYDMTSGSPYNAILIKEELNISLDPVITPDYEFDIIQSDYYMSNIEQTGDILNNYSYEAFYNEEEMAQDKFNNRFFSTLANELVQDVNVSITADEGVGIWANTSFNNETSIFQDDANLNTKKDALIINNDNIDLEKLLSTQVNPENFDAGELLAYNEEDYFMMFSMIRMNQFASFTNEHFIIGTKNEPYKQPYCKLTVYGSFKSSKAIFVDDAFYENEQKMNSLQNNLVNGRIFSQGLIVGGLNDVRSTVNEGGILCSTLHTKGNIIMNNSTSLFIGGTELDEYTLDNIINNSVGWSGDTADFGNNIYNSDGDTIEINQDTQITGDFDVSATNITLNGDTNITGSYISIEGDTDITGSLTISSDLTIGSQTLTEVRLNQLITADLSGGGGGGGGGSWTGDTDDLIYDYIYNSNSNPIVIHGDTTIQNDGTFSIGSSDALTDSKLTDLINADIDSIGTWDGDVQDFALIYNGSHCHDYVEISGHTTISGELTVSNNATIRGNMVVEKSLQVLSLQSTNTITGNITGNVTGNIDGIIGGNTPAAVTGTTITGTTITANTKFVGDLEGNVTGTIITAAQTNITSVGQLTGLNVAGNIVISSYNTLKIGSKILTEARLGELINANLSSGGGGGGGSWTGNTNSLNYDTIYNSTNIPVAVSGNMTISGTLLVAETGKDIISIRDGKLFIGSKELTEEKIQLLDNVLSYEVSSSTPSIERSSTDNMFDGDSDVKGRMYSNQLDAGDGKFTVDNDGQAFAMGMVIASDKRLKCDIQTLDTEIDILSQLRGVSYKLNKTFSGDKQFSKKTKYGVIAQEIQEHMPHIVNEDNKFLSVDYIQLVAFMPQLYRKIKKLEKEKQQQEQTIELLTKEFTDMKHKMKQMEEMIQTVFIKRV